MRKQQDDTETCLLPTITDQMVPPHGPGIEKLRVRTTYHRNVSQRIEEDLSPSLVKFRHLASKWLSQIRSCWTTGPVEIYIATEGRVRSVAKSDDQLTLPDFSSIIREVPANYEQIAWMYFSCFAVNAVNQFPRKVKYQSTAPWVRQSDVQDAGGDASFLLGAVDWLENATSPSRLHRSIDTVPLRGSQRFAAMIHAELLSLPKSSGGKVPQIVRALNNILEREDFLFETLVDDAGSDHLQATQAIAKPVSLLSQLVHKDRPSNFVPTLGRLWLEALLHSPQPNCLPEFRSRGNQPLKPPIQPLPITPFVTNNFSCIPLYLWKPSKLLGMICLRGNSSLMHQQAALQEVGSLVESFILDAIKDNLLLMEAPRRFKESQTDSQVASVINYFAESLIGANDNCIQFRDKTTGAICCAEANCQYMHVDFGPGLDAESENGTVGSNLFDDSIHGEIISDLMNDERHIAACRKFVEEHNTTFYDRSSLNVKMRHDDSPGIAVLQHPIKDFYSQVDFVEMDSILQMAEMRFDELIAEGYRDFIKSRQSETPFSTSVFRETLYNLDGEGVLSFLQGRFKQKLDQVALLGKTGPSKNMSISMLDRFRGGETECMLNSPEFVKRIAMLTDNQDHLRAFWTDSNADVWCDQFYNSGRWEMLSRHDPAAGLPAGKLVLWKPLTIVEGNMVLWMERDLTQEESGSFDIFLNHQARRKTEAILRDLDNALTTHLATSLNRNALRGVISRPLQHNIGSLIFEAQAAANEVREAAKSDEESRILSHLGFKEIEDSLTALVNAFRGFAAMVRPTNAERVLVEDLHRRLSNQLLAESRNSKIDVEQSSIQADGFVRADVNQLKFAFRELLNNTKDEFAETNTSSRTISLNAEQNEGCLQLIYEDSGRGIDPEKREWVFQSATSTKSRGTGLGMFLVRGLVSANNGRVYSESSDILGGVKIVIELPLDEALELAQQ